MIHHMFHQILNSRESHNALERDRQVKNKHFGDTYYTPDDKRQLELMRKTEDRQPQERKHTRFCEIQIQKRRVRLMLTADTSVKQQV